ncbi:MAG: type I-B CRISPR-associated protein Cas5b [Candidatus Ratteibacteria bacterium]
MIAMLNETATIFLEAFQPFAQYRNPFTFYYAQTYPLPPKSTIIGMLQNACDDWYGNNFGVEKWWELKVSIHGGFETIFWNYQNLIKGETKLNNSKLIGGDGLPLYGEGRKSQRSPVYQQELFNGHLYIFLRGQEELIDKIKECLEKPKKVLTLGRSEDVIFIKNIKEVNPDNTAEVEGDLKLTYPTYIKRSFPIKNKKYPVYSIPVEVIFENSGSKVTHKAEIDKDNTEREVKFEPVIYTGYDYSILIKENESIEVEFYDIDNKKIRIINEWGWL